MADSEVLCTPAHYGVCCTLDVGVLTLDVGVCFRHCSEYCAHQVFTPNALIKLVVFNYVIQTNEKACTFYVYTAKCKV